MINNHKVIDSLLHKYKQRECSEDAISAASNESIKVYQRHNPTLYLSGCQQTRYAISFRNPPYCHVCTPIA